MDEKKATISAINAHLTRKRSSESMNEVKMGACWADDTFVVLLRGASPWRTAGEWTKCTAAIIRQKALRAVMIKPQPMFLYGPELFVMNTLLRSVR